MTGDGARTRLDRRLVTLGLAGSRARAADAVARGCVRVDGAVERRPGRTVGPDAAIAVDDPAARYVSRAALKLVAGLDLAGIDPAGRVCLDVGASTGGFTQVLLERGAAHVFALDVGTGQLDPRVAADERVEELRLNARDLAAEALGGRLPEIVVCDVSFISLTLALPPALALAQPGAAAVLLVKPQFEVGRGGVGKGGIVDEAAGAAVAERLQGWLDACPGWRSTGLAPSPIHGGDGNREWLLTGAKHGHDDGRGSR